MQKKCEFRAFITSTNVVIMKASWNDGCGSQMFQCTLLGATQPWWPKPCQPQQYGSSSKQNWRLWSGLSDLHVALGNDRTHQPYLHMKTQRVCRVHKLGIVAFSNNVKESRTGLHKAQFRNTVYLSTIFPHAAAWSQQRQTGQRRGAFPLLGEPTLCLEQRWCWER